MEKYLQKQITSWLKSGQDYHSGLSLLIQVCKNRSLVRNLSRNNTPKNVAKIAAELRKAAGMSSFVKPIQSDKKKEEPGSNQIPSSKAGKAFKEVFKTYPPIIQKLIKRIGDLYSKREILHFDLKKVPELNTPDNVEKRRLIMEQLILISDELEHLNKYKKQFLENKTIPAEEDLEFLPKRPAAKSKPRLQIGRMSEAQLLRKLSNLRTSLTKKRNKLLYQHVSKQPEENPMPEGMKRDQLEEQIREDEKLIKKIQKRLDGFTENK